MTRIQTENRSWVKVEDLWLQSSPSAENMGRPEIKTEMVAANRLESSCGYTAYAFLWSRFMCIFLFGHDKRNIIIDQYSHPWVSLP